MTRPRSIRTTRWLVAAVTLAVTAVVVGQERQTGGPRVLVTFPAELSKTAVDGRLILMISRDDGAEPRTQIVDGPRTQQAFGIDVDGWTPGVDAAFDRGVLGFPRQSLTDVTRRHVHGPGAPAQVRDVQALGRPHRQAADGPRRRAAVERGARQPLQHARRKSPSTRRRRARFGFSLDKMIPPIPDPPTTKYIKHEQDPERAADEVLGPPDVSRRARPPARGFRRPPDARYPLVIFHGHFPQTFGGFREEPPDPKLKPDYSERFHLAGYNRTDAGGAPTGSTRSGPVRIIRACSSSRSSTPTRTTTTRTP